MVFTAYTLSTTKERTCAKIKADKSKNDYGAGEEVQKRKGIANIGSGLSLGGAEYQKRERYRRKDYV